jgi:hypothetical protein
MGISPFFGIVEEELLKPAYIIFGLFQKTR